MFGIKKFFAVFVCSAFIFDAVASVDANCANKAYKSANPGKCQSMFGTTTLLVGGGTLLAGGIAAMALGGASGGSSGNAGPQQTMRANYHVGADVDSAHLAAVMSTDSYERNFDQYNEIRAGYSIARGYTGRGTTIAVLDTSEQAFHGAYVAAIAGGDIATDAQITRYAIAESNSKFLSYGEMANIIKSVENADVYNNSWNVTQTANTIHTREQITELTDENFINSISDAARKDKIFVWAAGNEGMNQSGALSAMPRVIPELNGHFVNVVAYDSASGALANFSNQCGITMNYCITAPGTNIDTGEKIVSGTSFAAPIVSAAIAVIRQAHPYITASDTLAILFDTARDLGVSGVDAVYGHGMLDLERATRPVGVELIPISETVTTPRTSARVSSNIAHNMKSAGIKFAFVDGYGRAFETNIADNIKIVNRSRGWDRLRTPINKSVNIGNLEFGFENNEFLMGTGFIKIEPSTTSYIALNNKISVTNNTTFFQRTKLGRTAPHPTPDSMITNFSDIYTATVSLGIHAQDWEFGITIPDTILSGTMTMHAPQGRQNNGTLVFSDIPISLTGAPTTEYSIKYKFLTTAFVDNPYGKDEFYIIAKSKFVF